MPLSSSKDHTAKKIELKLKKSVDNVNWMKIERAGESKLLATSVPSQANSFQAPSYPTSSKNKKDWS